MVVALTVLGEMVVVMEVCVCACGYVGVYNKDGEREEGRGRQSVVVQS